MTHKILATGLAVALLLASGCRQAESEAPAPEPTTPAPPEAATVAEPAGDEAPAPRIDIRNARTPAEGVLTGGQPTVEQLEETARAGYKTVVNLRPPGENTEWDEASKAAELGLRYVNIEVAGAAGLTAENARLLAEIVDDPQARPVMVHCASGNRVGALFALKAFHVDGENAERALQLGLEAGLTKLEEAVKERLSAGG